MAHLAAPVTLKALPGSQKTREGYFPYPSRSDYKLAQLRHRAKLKRFQLDSVLSTILDERFDITEVVSQSAQELERMEQVLPDREVRRERRKRRKKKMKGKKRTDSFLQSFDRISRNQPLWLMVCLMICGIGTW